MPESIDVDEDKDIPTLAERLYHSYNSDALDFLMDAYLKVIDFIPELYPSMPADQRDKARQIMTLEAIVKFCQLAENLGAIAIGFKQTYQDEKEEILGIFKTIAKYDIGQIMDFYKHIKDRDLQYIAKFIGYPPLRMQSHGPRRFLEMSCQNIKTDMIEIAELYDMLRPLYDAQKHGYRISFGTVNETGADGFAYFDIGNNQKAVLVSKDDFMKIRQRASSCYKIIEVIFASHKERIRYETNGSILGASLKISLFRKQSDPKPTKDDLAIRYPSRGEMLKLIREEGEVVYTLFKGDLEKNHYGKIVAFDIDAKKIVALDYDLDKVIQIVDQSSSTGRTKIRRVGKDDRTGIEIY